MVEWSEDHMAAIDSFKLKLWFSWWIMVNWRPGGARRWKGETISWEGQGVVCGKLAPSRL
jgi:hypothetical protein